MTEFPVNETLLRKIVHSINKAVSSDCPQYIREHYKETNNAIRHLRGDYINENLRRYAVSDEVDLIRFNRSFWDGRMLVDKIYKNTYSVTTQATLNRIPRKKDRKTPHFLHSVLAVENQNCECQYIQQSLFPVDKFDYETLKNDYNKIFSSLINPNEGYTHYVISYVAKHDELLDIKLEVLDPNFNVVYEKSLNEYIEPDYSKLTETNIDNDEALNSSTQNVRSILSIKDGIRPALKEIERKDGIRPQLKEIEEDI